MEQVLSTVHGSRLYGLHHAHSDYDTYTVFRMDNKKYVKQSLKDGADDFKVSLDYFFKMCDQGVPQALEALFSPYAVMDSRFESMFRNYRVGHTETAMRYRRTVRNFGFALDSEGEVVGPHESFKRRRHAYRLALNLSEVLRTGRFNPVLSEAEKEFVNYGAELEFPEHYAFLTKALERALVGKHAF